MNLRYEPIKILIGILIGVTIAFKSNAEEILKTKEFLTRNILKEDNFISDSLITRLKDEIDFNSSELSYNKIKDSLVYNILIYLKGKHFLDNELLTKADSTFNLTIKYFNHTNNYSALGLIYIDKSEIFRKLNQLDIAQEFSLIAIKNLIKTNNNEHLISAYKNLGFIYLDLKNYSLGEDYFLKALNLSSQLTIDKEITSAKLGLATSYLFQKKTSDVLFIYNELLKTNNLSPKDSSLILFNSATAYLINNDYKNSIDLFNQCLILREKLNDDKGIVKTHNNLAKIFLLKGNFIEAKIHLTKCYNYAKKNDDVNLLYSTSYNMLDYFISVGKKDSAKIFLKEYTHLRDSIKNYRTQKSILELDKKYKTLEKDNQIALLQKEDELKEAKLSNQLLIIISITSVLIVLLALGYFINRQRIRLKKSESDLKKQQKQIEKMNGELKISNQAKDRILSIIGHDLRGPIGGLKELIELYMEIPTYDEEDFRNLLKAAREASTGSYHLLENLLTWANSQRGQIDFKPVTAPLLPLIKHSIDLLDSSINTRNISFKYEIPTTLKLTADLNMLRTIIRNLVSNAVKYSPPESCITISAKQNNEETFICIADQGYGMSAEQSAVLFEKKETFFIEAGYNAKGTGLGLILCKDFIELHNGRIWADSKPNVGTKVCFTIPVHLSETKTSTKKQEQIAATN